MSRVEPESLPFHKLLGDAVLLLHGHTLSSESEKAPEGQDMIQRDSGLAW